MIFNLFRYFSLRYLILHPFRSLLTALGVALGISLFLSIRLLNDATLRSLDQNIESMTGKSDLTITSDGMGFEEAVLEKVKGLASVKAAIPLILNYAYVDDSPEALPMVFLGIDMLKDTSIRDYNEGGGDIVPDPLAFVNQADSVIVTKTWAAQNKLAMEESIDLLTKEGVKSFAIRGLIDNVGPAKAFNGRLAIMDIDGARYNFGRDGLYDRIDILVQPQASVKELKKELQTLLGARFRIEDKAEQSESMQQLVKSVQDVSNLLGLIAFLVSFMIIVNTVNTAISQRRKDIGSLRAFGAASHHIVILFAGEFLFLALISSILGCFIGMSFAESSADQMARGLNSTLMTNVNQMTITFGPSDLLASVILGLLSSSIALIYPLYKALQINPIEAIKPAVVDFTHHKKPKIFIWAAWLGLVLMSLTVAADYFSAHQDWLQTKEIQPLILLLGLSGIVLMGPYLVLTLLGLLHRLPLPFLFKFSMANLLKNPLRTASTSIHLSLGFSLVIIVTAINLSFKSTILGWTERITSMPHAVNITPWGSISGLQIQPLHESLIPRLQSTLPGLNPGNTKPILSLRIIPLTIQSQRYIVKAYDKPADTSIIRYIDPIEGSAKDLADALFNPTRDTLLLSETMLKNLDKKVGDTLEIDTPSGRASFLIGGNIREFASPNGVIYMDREVYKKYWKDPLVTLITVDHDPALTSTDFIALINSQVKAEHLVVNLPSKLREEVARNLEDNMAMSDSTKWVALFIGTLGLLNSILIAILQRFRELGCIRSIGMTRGQMLLMILLESASLGFIGILVSFALTIPLSYLWVNSTLSYMLGWKVDFFFTLKDFFLLFGIGLFVSFISGIFPALKAAGLKLREALEYE